jgi:nucleoid DNA-binding protein
MKRFELSEQISKETEYPVYKVDQILKSFINKVGDELLRNGEVVLRGLGVFKVKDHKCSDGITRKVTKFIVYKQLKEKVNQKIK